MLNLNSIMLGSSDTKKLAEFYEKVLGRPADMIQDNWWGWSVGSAFLSMGPHSKVTGMAREPERIMFNFETKEVDVEFARIKELGATVIADPATNEYHIATFADPDGNYFQLMAPWEPDK